MEEIIEARASKDAAKIEAAEMKAAEFNAIMEQVGGWDRVGGWVVGWLGGWVVGWLGACVRAWAGMGWEGVRAWWVGWVLRTMIAMGDKLAIFSPEPPPPA